MPRPPTAAHAVVIPGSSPAPIPGMAEPPADRYEIGADLSTPGDRRARSTIRWSAANESTTSWPDFTVLGRHTYRDGRFGAGQDGYYVTVIISGERRELLVPLQCYLHARLTSVLPRACQERPDDPAPAGPRASPSPTPRPDDGAG